MINSSRVALDHVNHTEWASVISVEPLCDTLSVKEVLYVAGQDSDFISFLDVLTAYRTWIALAHLVQSNTSELHKLFFVVLKSHNWILCNNVFPIFIIFLIFLLIHVLVKSRNNDKQ